jgi:glycyl-tRNA synthetase
MADLMEAVTSLAKRRGIAFQSSEIYGGLRSSWDYGPLGVELRRNIRQSWWRSMVQLRDDVVGLEAAIIMSPKVWEASGHVAGFHDPLVECLNCHQRFREDHLGDDPTCPNCGQKRFTEPQQFNMMFKTHMGPVEDESSGTYRGPNGAGDVRRLRARPAGRAEIPFGIAKIVESFRNSHAGNFIFRTREFEQMGWNTSSSRRRRRMVRVLDQRADAVASTSGCKGKLRLRPHGPDELAHYASRRTWVRVPVRVAGVEASRTAPTSTSRPIRGERRGPDVFDQEKDSATAYVVEPAAGVDRIMLTALVDAYREEEAPTAKGGTGSARTWPCTATSPTKVAVLRSRATSSSRRTREVFDLVGGRGCATSTMPARSAAGTAARTRWARRSA